VREELRAASYERREMQEQLKNETGGGIASSCELRENAGAALVIAVNFTERNVSLRSGDWKLVTGNSTSLPYAQNPEREDLRSS
jgi:hypothetical protein